MLLLAFVAHIEAYGFLHADGTKMRDDKNSEVILKGVGLGGWMVQEGYMLNPAGSSNVGPQWSMKKQYYNEGRSDDEVESFYSSWRNNFVTKADIDYIKSLGFNSVRLPLHYEMFLTNTQRAVRNSVIRDSNNYGTYLTSLQQWCQNDQIATDQSVEAFKIIDNVLDWCGANEMYVVLDMHAAPGGQGTDVNIADALFPNNLWDNAWVFQDVLTRMWKQIAIRYRADPRVAFYDILNEPNNVPNGNPPIHDLLQKLITTIRDQADNHMIMIEGNGWGNEYNYLEPFTFSPNWGLVYNAHRYGTTTSTTTTNPDANQINELGNLVAFSQKYQVPVWVGETGENSDSWLRANINAMDSLGIGWAHWTYKRFDYQENAALMRIGGSWPTDGSQVMSEVISNIQYAKNIKNDDTINAVAPNRKSYVKSHPPKSLAVSYSFPKDKQMIDLTVSGLKAGEKAFVTVSPCSQCPELLKTVVVADVTGNGFISSNMSSFLKDSDVKKSMKFWVTARTEPGKTEHSVLVI